MRNGFVVVLAVASAVTWACGVGCRPGPDPTPSRPAEYNATLGVSVKDLL